MADIKISSRAYTKMILHAAKYPHLAVNGVLLAKESTKGGRSLQIVDAIPLFHQCIYVTPMTEVALVQIEAIASDDGLQIAGYYAAAENFNDNSMDKAPGIKIADKIADYVPNAAVIVIDNKALTLVLETPAIRVWQMLDGRWTKTSSFGIEQSENTLDAVSSLVQKGAAKDLNDFDNYLDNIQNDWTNSHLNRDLPQLLAMY